MSPQRFFDGEVEPCINGRTIETGAYFGVGVAPIVERTLAERLDDGGWNCDAENGSVRSSFDTTINVLERLLEFEQATGGSADVSSAGRVHFDCESGVGTPSRCNTLRALRVLDWWDAAA